MDFPTLSLNIAYRTMSDRLIDEKSMLFRQLFREEEAL